MKYMNLYNILNIDINTKYNEIDEKYRNIPNKTKEQYFAWKILRDKYYSQIYRKYLNEDIVYDTGFIDDKLNLNDIDFYKLNLLTTPFFKILNNIKDAKNPVVILSTGGFCPIHDGHLYMMEEAKKILEINGYDVVGGYFSPSHDNYVLNKPNVSISSSHRIYNCQKAVINSDWIMIDPFEANYIKTYVNFTEIINRLELYLRKYVNKKIKVAYVFGADNAEFMYCFEDQGIGICVDRNGYHDLFLKMKNKLNGKNNFYIEDNLSSTNLSSRNIRKETISKNIENKKTGTYIIRDEGLLPFKKISKGLFKHKLVFAQKVAIEELEKLFKKELNINVKKVIVKEQLDKAKCDLQNKNTISLDTYYKGTYNLKVSRQFELSDLQSHFTKIVNRTKIEIPCGNYILVDDDSVSGETIKEVNRSCLQNVNITENYFLASQYSDEIFDVVDFRDFIIGSKDGGLLVRINNKKNIRVPYINPFVSLFTRANIPLDREKYVSSKIIDININFYSSINKNIKLKDLSEDTIYLFTLMGYDKEDCILNILKNLKKFLTK